MPLDGGGIPLHGVSTMCRLALGVNQFSRLEEILDDKCRIQRDAGLVCRLMELA